MRILLDTSILLWATSGTDRLDQQAIMLLENRSNTILFSAASIWEIAIKAGLKRPDFTAAPDVVLSDAREAGFEELPIRAEATSRASALPHHHRDPFDRLLIAQAMAEPAVFLTPNKILASYSDLVTVVSRP